MTLTSYQSQQLIEVLETLQSKQASGTLYINTQINSGQNKKRSRVLVWQEGRITYSGISVPDTQSLVKMLQQKLNREWVDSAVNFAMRQATNQTSIRAFLERLVNMQLFTWEQIETVFRHQIVVTLEQVLPHAGQFEFDSRGQFSICRGLELSKLMQDLAHRQERWLSIQSFIPSMDAVPHIKANVLETIAEPAVRQHLRETVNSQRSLVDIAELMDKDPLIVAQSYLQWVQAGWVEMEGNRLLPTAIIKTSTPTVLAVDDSTVMQKVIK